MNLHPFTGPGSTPARRKFWNDAAAAVKSAQKLAGRNASVIEQPGKGTIIDFNRPPSTAGFPCFTADNVQVTFSGIVMDCACLAGPGTGSFSVDTNNLNAVFTLPRVSSGTGWSSYALNVDDSDAVLSVTEYGDSNDCSTSPDTNDRGALIIVYCTDGTNGDPPGTYMTVNPNIATAPPDYFGAFYAHDPATGITSFTNEFECGVEISDAVGFDSFGMAHGGTATIIEL